MGHPQQVKQRARRLRRKGFSLNEISAKLHIAKSTASLWLRGVEISRQGQQRLHAREERGHEYGLRRAKSRVQRKYRAVRQEAYEAGKASRLTKLDALCVGLYWGEGNKYDRRWAFSNSDRKTVELMVNWAVRAGQRPDQFKAVVQVHPEDEITDGRVRRFWARAGIPRQNISVTRIRSKGSKRVVRNRTPYGTCSLRPIKNGARLFSYYEGQRDQTL